MNQNNPLHDPDVNLAILSDSQDVFNCNYYSTDSFKTLKQQFPYNGISVLCFNIGSFSRNGYEYLRYLFNCELDFDIIIFTETWAKVLTYTLCHIPGYNPTHNLRENCRGGGVSIFVKESFDFSVIEAINTTSDFMETVAITFQCELTG